MKKLLLIVTLVLFLTPSAYSFELGKGFYLDNRVKLEMTDDDRYQYRYELGSTFGKKGFPISISWSHRTDVSDVDGKDDYYYNTYKLTYKVPSLSIFRPEFNVEHQRWWNDTKVTRGGIQVRF
jgi:hypothetical protein